MRLNPTCEQKLQGRTLPKLVISVCKRRKPPWMNLAAFYVLISRVRTFDSLRLLQYDDEGLQSMAALKHDQLGHRAAAAVRHRPRRLSCGARQGLASRGGARQPAVAPAGG